MSIPSTNLFDFKISGFEINKVTPNQTRMFMPQDVDFDNYCMFVQSMYDLSNIINIFGNTAWNKTNKS